MEPFKILCNTCTAALKVSKPSLIGRTLPCPKCGDMVTVVNPAQPAPTKTTKAESQPKPASIAKPTPPVTPQPVTPQPIPPVQSTPQLVPQPVTQQPVPANAPQWASVRPQNQASSKSKKGTKKGNKQTIIIAASIAGVLAIAGAVTAFAVIFSSGGEDKGADSEQLVAQKDAQPKDTNRTEPVATTDSDTAPLPPNEKTAESLEGASMSDKAGDSNSDNSDARNSDTNNGDRAAANSGDAVATPKPPAQKGNFVLSDVTFEYYQDPAVKNGMEVFDSEGNIYRVENTSRSKCIYIKQGNQWLRQGAAYRYSRDGDLSTKTTYEKGVKHGNYKKFFPNGALMIEYANKNGKKDGQHSQYWRDGSIQQEFFYVDGRRDGPSVLYHNGPGGEVGQQRIVSTYVNDKKHGEIRQFNAEGKLIAKWNYAKGKKVGKTTFY